MLTTSWFGVLLSLIVFYFLVTQWLNSRKFAKYLRNIPGPKSLPIIGNLLLFKRVTDVPTVLLRLLDEFKGSFLIYLGPLPRLWICDQKMVECLLNSQTILDKSYEYNYFHDWLGTGLLTSTEAKWKSRRKLLTPAFHFQILQKYIQTFNSQSDTLTKILKTKVDEGPFDVFPYMALCTLDIICETAMGVKINAQQNSKSSYVLSVTKMCQIFVERTLSVIKMFNFIYKFTLTYQSQRKALSIIHGFANSVVASRKKHFTKGNLNNIYDDGVSRKVAFLDLLLGYNLIDEGIREEVDTFMFAGHDTTAAGISFSLYCISKNPDVQMKVVEELKSIFNGDNEREATYQDLQEMKYLEMVIKESLRLYPPVPLYSRSLNRDTLLNGRLLPKGITLTISPFLLHRDPKTFANPEKFDPDRFLPHNSADRSPYAYVPFSAGPRNCIGQRFAMLEMKCIISTLLRSFELFPVQNHEPELLLQVILKSNNGLPLRIKTRSV